MSGAPQHDVLWPIPESWSWTSTGQVADVIGGGTPRTDNRENYDGGEIPWITPADLSGYSGKFISRGARNITQKGFDGSGARLMPEGAVLFSSRAPIGYVAVASNAVCTNQGFKSFVLPAGLLPDYVYYYLQRAKDIVVSLASGTTFLEISGAKAAQIPLPLAPTPEQRRIVSEIEKQLTCLDAAVGALKRVQADLKRYRAAVLRAACEGRLVPTEAELARKEGRPYETGEQLLARILKERRAKWEADQLTKILAAGNPPKDDRWKRKYKEPEPPDASRLPTLPEGWTWATVGQAMFIIDYRGRTPPFAESGIPHLRSSNIRNGQILWEDLAYVNQQTYEDYMTRGLPQSGDLLFTTEAPLGEVAEAPDSRLFSVAQRLMILRSSSSLILPKFLMYQIMGPLFQAAIRLSQTGSTVDGISSRNFRPVPVCVPPVAEQRRVVYEIERLLSTFTAMEQVVGTSGRRADRLRQAILKRAFEGKLAPQDPNDEPASVLLERIRVERAANAGPVRLRRLQRPKTRAAKGTL